MRQRRVSLRQLPHFHRAVRAAREQTPGVVDMYLRDALANVFEEGTSSMFPCERVQQLMCR